MRNGHVKGPIDRDTDTAVTISHQAIDAVTALQSLHTSPGVAELRDRLSTTAI